MIFYFRISMALDLKNLPLTSLAFLQLIDEISSSVDNKEYCAGIFLDLSKAFDTVNHAILIEKLEHCGTMDDRKWMCSYLTDRKQYVECNCVASEYQTVKCGVLTVFLLYITDIHLS